MKHRRRVLAAAAAGAILVVAALWSASIHMDNTARGRVFADPSATPPHKVGLVLGCSPTLKSGNPNPYFVRRIDAAASLWKSGKVQFLLLSGDNHVAWYDEPTRMKEALLSRGVPESALVLDYAGFSTFDSVARAHQVFGLNDLCLITQPDHAKRAIYISDHVGVKADAFTAAPVNFRAGLRTWAREGLARVRTVLDLKLLGRKPHFLGPKIQIAQVPPRSPIALIVL